MPRPATLSIDSPEAIATATHPVRAAILAAMRAPSTAAAVGRTIDQSRQNVAYHVQELVKVGLLRHFDERRVGSFVEQRYVAAAPTIVISPRVTWGDDPSRARAMADQLSLGQLVDLGERVQRETAALLDCAAFDGETIASASASTKVRFASAEDRGEFLRDYVEMLTELTVRHGSDVGDQYEVVLAAYPTRSNE